MEGEPFGDSPFLIACQHQIGGGNAAPVGLVQILAEVVRSWVIGCVVLHSHWPVVCSPDNLAAGHGGTGAESTGTGKEADCFHGAPEKTKPARLGPGGLGFREIRTGARPVLMPLVG